MITYQSRQWKRLAIRDFKSSDPYVVIRVANQTAKTKVIYSCLNPEWNEEFTFHVKEPLDNLKLTAKTKVIYSCLNPEWNEEFTFHVKEPLDNLKLVS